MPSSLTPEQIACQQIEARKDGITLSTVAEQSARYANSLPDFRASGLSDTLLLLYDSTDFETFCRDERVPAPRSRRVFTFHRPKTLAEKTRIVAEELESVVTANVQRVTRLRQSILQKAFTGELTDS